MMRVTMLIATMMVEIAVSTSTLITVLIVLVFILKIVLLGLFLMLLAMASVMMRLTMQTAIMMEEIVVELAHPRANVPIVSVLVELMMIHVTVSPTVSTTYFYFGDPYRSFLLYKMGLTV